MSWKTLSDDQRKFIVQFFPKGKSWRKKAENRSENREVIAQYEEYYDKARLAGSVLFNLQLAPGYPDLNRRYVALKENVEAKGSFAAGVQYMDLILRDAYAMRDAAVRAAATDAGRTDVFQDHARVLYADRAEDQLLVGRLKVKLQELASADEDQEPVDADNLPLVRQLEQAYHEGHNGLAAINKGDLSGEAYKDALGEVLKTTKAKCTRITDELEEMIASAEALASANTVLESDRAFREKLADCNDLVRELAFWGLPKATKLEKDLDGVDKDTRETEAYDVGMSALTLWERDAQKVRADHLTAFNTALEPHKTDLAKVEQIKAGIGSAAKPEQMEELDMLIAMAQQTIATAEDPAKGKNIAALRPLQGILVSAANLARELVNAATLNPIIRTKISEIATILGDPDSVGNPDGKTVLPVKFDAMRTKFTDLHGDWLSMPPQKAQMAFIELQMEAEAFKTAVEAMKAWRAARNRDVAAAEKSTKDVAKIIYDFGQDDHGAGADLMRQIFGRTGIKFEGTAAAELDVIRRDIASEDATTHTYTESKLQQLKTKLDGWHLAAGNLRDAQKAGTSPTADDMKSVAAILDDQKQAVEDREAKEAAIADFVSKSEKVKDFIVQLASDATLSDETKQEYADIKALNSAAISQASNDLEAAEEMHSRVKFRMTRAMGAPPKAVDNFDWLGKMPAFWRGATGSMRDAVETLKQTIEREAEDDDRVNRAQLEDDLMVLGAVVSHFEDAAFDAAAGVLGDRGTASDLDGRKKAREEALRQVRLYRGYLTSNALLRHVIKNPFKVDGIASVMALSLNKIELEVLRGI